MVIKFGSRIREQALQIAEVMGHFIVEYFEKSIKDDHPIGDYYYILAN